MKSRLFLPVVLAIFLVLAATRNVFAATLDQKQESWSLGWGISGYTLGLGQEFKPTLNRLEAVEVRIGTISYGSGDDTITLTVRDGTIDGTILATASKFLTDGSGGWIRFDLTPISVTPESTYVIRLTATKLTFGWQGVNSNAYPRGRAIFNAVPWDSYDLAFRTYGSTAATTTTSKSSVGGIIVTTNTFTILTPYLALIGLVATAAVALKKRR